MVRTWLWKLEVSPGYSTIEDVSSEGSSTVVEAPIGLRPQEVKGNGDKLCLFWRNGVSVICISLGIFPNQGMHVVIPW